MRCEQLRATLHDPTGEPTATMCGFAYLGDEAWRPVTFFWNGGPGFCSSMLHTGFAAPQVADLAGDGHISANPLTLVDRTDLVYVDPVGTGFSRAIAPTEDDAFFGIHEDARAAAQFVAAVVAERGWSDRPIVLCGESYGGIRVAAMLAPLRELGVVPDGLILISPALDWRSIRPIADDDVAVAAVDAVPSLAALALSGEVDDAARRATIDAACRFAIGPLLAAVRAGEDPLDPDDEALAAELERFTGGRTLRTLRGVDQHDARQRRKGMRIGGVSLPACDTAIATVLAANFDIEQLDDYRRNIPRIGSNWRGEHGELFGVSDVRATAMLAAACRDGYRPRVFVAGGWFDTVVPFGVALRLAAEDAFGDCELELRDYAAGHMIYVDAAAHAELVADLRSWFDRRPR